MSGIGSRFDVRGSMLEVEWIFSVLFRVSVAFLFDEIQKTLWTQCFVVYS